MVKKSQKTRERRYIAPLQLQVTTAHRSGRCLCSSMLTNNVIEDVPTIVIIQATPSMPHKLVLCEVCAGDIMDLISSGMVEISLREESDVTDNS